MNIFKIFLSKSFLFVLAASSIVTMQASKRSRSRSPGKTLNISELGKKRQQEEQGSTIEHVACPHFVQTTNPAFANVGETKVPDACFNCYEQLVAEKTGSEFPYLILTSSEQASKEDEWVFSQVKLRSIPRLSVKKDERSLRSLLSKIPKYATVNCLLIFGDHGGIGEAFNRNTMWWQKNVVVPLIRKNFKANFIIIDACHSASLTNSFKPLLTEDGFILGGITQIFDSALGMNKSLCHVVKDLIEKKSVFERHEVADVVAQFFIEKQSESDMKKGNILPSYQKPCLELLLQEEFYKKKLRYIKSCYLRAFSTLFDKSRGHSMAAYLMRVFVYREKKSGKKLTGELERKINLFLEKRKQDLIQCTSELKMIAHSLVQEITCLCACFPNCDFSREALDNIKEVTLLFKDSLLDCWKNIFVSEEEKYLTNPKDQLGSEPCIVLLAKIFAKINQVCSILNIDEEDSLWKLKADNYKSMADDYKSLADAYKSIIDDFCNKNSGSKKEQDAKSSKTQDSIASIMQDSLSPCSYGFFSIKHGALFYDKIFEHETYKKRLDIILKAVDDDKQELGADEEIKAILKEMFTFVFHATKLPHRLLEHVHTQDPHVIFKPSDFSDQQFFRTIFA